MPGGGGWIVERVKGCNCKQSRCLKLYCEVCAAARRGSAVGSAVGGQRDVGRIMAALCIQRMYSIITRRTLEDMGHVPVTRISFIML